MGSGWLLDSGLLLGSWSLLGSGWLLYYGLLHDSGSLLGSIVAGERLVPVLWLADGQRVVTAQRLVAV